MSRVVRSSLSLSCTRVLFLLHARALSLSVSTCDLLAPSRACQEGSLLGPYRDSRGLAHVLPLPVRRPRPGDVILRQWHKYRNNPDLEYRTVSLPSVNHGPYSHSCGLAYLLLMPVWLIQTRCVCVCVCLCMCVCGDEGTRVPVNFKERERRIGAWNCAEFTDVRFCHKPFLILTYISDWMYSN